MWPELAAGAVLGGVSSLHCVQMCGPLVLAFSLNGKSGWISHTFYHLGRVATYTALGAAAGALGSGLGWLAGVERNVTLAAGVLLILAGGLFTWILPGSKKLVQIRMPGLLSRLSARLLLAPGWSRKLLMGLAMGFLPCGMIYAALIQAAAAADAAAGAAVMSAFGITTSAPLLAIGAMSPVLSRLKWAKYTSQLTAATLVLMGSILLWRGYTASSPTTAASHPHSCHAPVSHGQQQQHPH
jgi:sulfite exporter TauE/SafE